MGAVGWSGTGASPPLAAALTAAGQAPVLSCVLESAGLPGLEGRTVLVTGANTGIGFNIALAVASRWLVVLAGVRRAGSQSPCSPPEVAGW